jgi:hypothetical protein
MRIFLLGFTFFGIFGLLARYYAVQHIWQATDLTDSTTPNGANNMESSAMQRDNTLTLYYHDSLLLGGYETFALDANNALDLTTNNRVFLEQALRFLKQNPDKNLHITATFQRNETSDEYYETRGIARAAMLRDYLVHAGLPIERMSLNDAMTDTKPTFLFEIQDTDTPVLRFDEKEMTFFDDNFLEHAATFRPKNSFTNYMNGVKTYLDSHKSSHLVMTLYMDGNNQEKTEEFAISRAEAVKNHIVALGLIAYKIKIDIKINDVLVVKDNSYNATLKNHRFTLAIVD